jgi:uncharacterized protein YndB with AHSA1/START domain
MELKTKMAAEQGRQDILMTREFDLPVALLFKAFAEPDIFEQWMGTKVVKMECRPHGAYRFETSDSQGNVVFSASGVFHAFDTHKIIRTFEMENTPFPVQLEFLEFEQLTEDTSRLTMHIIYRTLAHRDQMLKMPFAQGLSMAHDRLQEIVNKLN